MSLSVSTKRHSLAHIMAQAVKALYPDAKMAIGPDIENGFYYDFDFGDTPINDDSLKEIEKKMKNLIKQNQKFEAYKLPTAEAIAFLKSRGEIYKIEMIHDLVDKGETEIGFYRNLAQNGTETFVDMCRGPHVEKTSELDENAFKLDKLAGAYWKGDEKNKQLTRIYAFAFDTREELESHLKMLEEAKKRDHRALGKKLELFAFDDEVGPGLPLWLPNGAVIVEELENLAKETEAAHGYSRVRSPHIAKQELYLRSGHLPYYEEDMFPAMEMDGERYFLKAMNCPHHHKIYAAVPKSYRDLPLRLAEYGHCYRYEDSGSLMGLMRVRSMCMNDAHIYCSEEQFEAEFLDVIEMYKYYFSLFQIEKVQFRLSKHSKEGLGKKYVDNERLWIETEDKVRKALIKSGVPFVEAENEAAFYGPKIDVQIWSAIGREFTLSTNQLDFAVPSRFNLTYVDADGSHKTPLCIHRAPLSTHERFIGFLIEHFAGEFPLWLAPKQIRVLPVSENFLPYASEVFVEFKKAGFRVELDDSSDGLGKKIRNAETDHVKYVLVIGEKETTDRTVSVRSRKTGEQIVMPTGEFLDQIRREVSSRAV